MKGYNSEMKMATSMKNDQNKAAGCYNMSDKANVKMGETPNPGAKTTNTGGLGNFPLK